MAAGTVVSGGLMFYCWFFSVNYSFFISMSSCVWQRIESDIDNKTAELVAVCSQCRSVTNDSTAACCRGSTELLRTVDELKSQFERLRAKADQRRHL